MSLLDDAMEECVMLDKTTVEDGYGGFIPTWRDGARFNAAIVFDSSMAARVASVQGVTDLYTVTTRKAVTLNYHDVFRRVRDGKIFRVTTDGDDKATPASASLDMRVVNAEEWEVTDG
jgi:hypothetical protein